MSTILDDLTDVQRQAVVHMEGPMLVVAGAGSGKTRVVTHRIAHLIERGVWPNQILALTFTNKAAAEMRDRVESLVGSAPAWVGTFHSACARFLRRDIEKLGDGRTRDFTIYDTADQASVIRLCMQELGCNPKEIPPNSLRARISEGKCRDWDPAELADSMITGGELLGEVYARYEEKMRALNALDFDDLLLLMVRLLEENPALRETYHARFRYLLVDEYQDTNRLQYLLMKRLTGPDRNVHATGDPDQSIYSWRGAEYRNILDFTEDYPDAKVVRLEQNYRSTRPILNAANELIRFNQRRIEKDLFTEKDHGSPVKVVRVSGERDEARWVVGRIEQLRLDGVNLRDMAIFYRTNAQSRAFEDVLLDVGIPYQIVGGTRFYERKEIKDILAHLQVLINPRDVVALTRVANCRPTGVGPKALAGLLRQCAEENIGIMDLLCDPDFPACYRGRSTRKLAAFGAWCRKLREIPRESMGDCIFAVIQHSGLRDFYEERVAQDVRAEDRLENLNALVDRGYEYEQARADVSIGSFLEEVTLISDIDSFDGERECLSLMTLHASKGLEFDHVFIGGVEEGYIPHQNSSEDAEAVEEERRLLYVGITRAKEEVCLLHAETRYTWNNATMRLPSRFLDELPRDEVEYITRSRRW